MQNRRLVILLSGRGSNFLAIADSIRRGDLRAEIACVVCNVEEAPGLARARGLGFETLVLPSRGLGRDEAMPDGGRHGDAKRRREDGRERVAPQRLLQDLARFGLGRGRRRPQADAQANPDVRPLGFPPAESGSCRPDQQVRPHPLSLLV